MSYGGADPYPHTDDVYRNVTIAPPPAENCYLEPDQDLHSMPVPPTDPYPNLKSFTYDGLFYHEPDDFIRGTSTGGGTAAELFNVPIATHGYLDNIGALSATKSYNSNQPQCEKFTNAHHPPNLPSDNFFKLHKTTFHVTNTTPFQLGNHLLKFFSGESHSPVSSSIIKVNHKKFSIKADDFIGSWKCTLKVRVYQEECAKYAIEFQRRSGDCVAFNKVYQQAAKFFQLHFATKVDFAEGTPEEFPKKQFKNEIQHLPPLIDMAGRVDQPSLQAEAAMALAHIAMQDELATSLCTLETFGVSKMLMHTDCIDIGYPIACMLSSLAQLPEAVPWFQKDDVLLQIIQKKMESQATSALVRQQLAQVWCIPGAAGS